MAFLGVRKRTWKKVLTVGVSVLLIIGTVAGLTALFGRDTIKIGAGEFKRGALDENGAYVKSTTSIYTEEAFSCQGLRIVPAFESSGEFDVYYYDDNGRFIERRQGLSAVYEEDFPAASHARVVYTPTKPNDVKASEWEIEFFEVRKYAKELTITVAKDQVEYKSSTDLYVAYEQTGMFTAENINEVVTNAAVQSSKMVTVNEKYDAYRIYVKVDTTINVNAEVMFGDAEYKAIMLDENNKPASGVAYTFLSHEMLSGSWYTCVVEVPAGATSLRVQGPTDAEFRIYGVEVK